jgi:hypothetical protein
MDAAGVHLKSVVADKLFRWGFCDAACLYQASCSCSGRRFAFHCYRQLFLFRGRFEMCQSFFSVLCGDIRVTLLAVINGRLEVSDAFFGMRIVLCLLCRLSMLERGFGMRYEHIRMALLAVIDGFLCMADGLGQMILG